MEASVLALPASRHRDYELQGVEIPERLVRIVALLERNHLFQGCSRDQLDYLAATAYPLRFEAGDLLCIEGTWAPVCYIIAFGRAAVRIGGAKVGDIGEGDVVGERGIVLETERAATVVATGPMLAWAIPRERLQTVLRDSRSVRDWMLADVNEHYPARR